MQDTRYATYPSLKNRVVLITGGATGIGEALVTQFARQGSRVAFLDILDEQAHALAALLAAESCQTPQYIHCDLTDLAALSAAVDQVIATQGTVDVLVNNAANDQRHTIEEVTPESWDRGMAINLRPHFFAVQAVLPAMRAAGRGSIVNMSSIAWIIPNTTLAVYVAAKAAIVGLTRTLAHDLGPLNIRVMPFCPAPSPPNDRSSFGTRLSTSPGSTSARPSSARSSLTKLRVWFSFSLPTTPPPSPIRATSLMAALFRLRSFPSLKLFTIPHTRIYMRCTKSRGFRAPVLPDAGP